MYTYIPYIYIYTYTYIYIGKNFLHLLVKHGPVNNKIHKIFNKKTVKVSYSCMKNVDWIISGHNHNILNPKAKIIW